MTVRLMQGDCRDVLRTLDAESVQCCVTSPPYFGLRDYGTASWDGGDGDCDHIRPFVSRHERPGGIGNIAKGGASNDAQDIASNTYRQQCGKCGATRIDQQIGLEPTVEAFVAEMVAVFREVKRVLRDDGTLWLNLGDSYANDGKWGGATGGKHANGLHGESGIGRQRVTTGLKPKDMIGIPWRVAFALQADGWHLRSDIIWSKPNPMPESVRDRPTKAHEYLFLLTKQPRYYWDAEAVREESLPATAERYAAGYNASWKRAQVASVTDERENGFRGEPDMLRGGRNIRSVWTISTAPFSEAHFATFPPALVEPCIKAGSSERGGCPACVAPWVRLTDSHIEHTQQKHSGGKFVTSGDPRSDLAAGMHKNGHAPGRKVSETIGWQPSCNCDAGDPVPCVVLDPFAGAGTTGLVADRLGRNAILIELNPAYAEMARKRITNDAPLFAAVEVS